MLAYVEVLPDEQQVTAINLINRALAWFNSYGVGFRKVMRDNGSAYIFKAIAKDCSVLKLRHICTRP